MQSLTETDLYFVLSRIPKDVRETIKTHGFYLAGGFIRAAIAGETPSDIDLFGNNVVALETQAKELADTREGRVHKTDNAFTVLSPPRIPVQLITRWTYSDPQKLITEFDFTVCQAVIWFELVGGWKSMCSDDFYHDLAAKRLRYTAPKRNEDAGGSLLRAIKYVKRGYKIPPRSLAGIVARLVRGVDISRNAIGHDPMISVDGSQHLSEEFLVPILHGLLREVDPLSVIDGLELASEAQ